MFPLIQWLALAYSVLNFVDMEELPYDCGIQINPSPNQRILGGLDAVPGEFPWQVQIIRYFRDMNNNPRISLCAGTIISSQWILTASHCVPPGTRNQDLEVHYNTIFSSDFGQFGQIPRFFTGTNNGDPLTNDWAVIKVTPPINLARDARPVCLVDRDDYSFQYCVAIGWGLIEAPKFNGSTGRPATSLKLLNSTRVQDYNCVNRFNFIQYNPANMMCVRGVQSGTNVCAGDSGGPLHCKSYNGRFYQIGIVSFGPPFCPRPNEFAVFSKVATAYRNIVNIVRNY